MNEIYSTANLGGGLGAQLFQIAHACAQGWKYNVQPAFSTKLYLSYSYQPDMWPQHFINNVYRNLKFVDDISDFVLLEEDNFNYNKFINENINFEKTVLFRGYFESWKNFMGYDEKIKDTFGPTNEFIEKANILYPEIQSGKTVSMHIRRGDFFNVSHILPVTDISYFKECISNIGEYDNLLIFSNDKAYANTLNFKNMRVVSGLENYEEMWLMSMCNTNIISNSTYSWWAQFLNKNKNKSTYAPSTWFGPAGPGIWSGETPGAPYDSIYENDWNVIDTRFENGYIVRNR
jgi:hypothetical protein